MKTRSFSRGTKLALILLIFVFLGACSSNSRAKQGVQRVVPVKTGDVMQQNVPVQVRTIGNVEAYSTVSIKAQVGGEVEGVYFQEGQDVKKNDLLFKIDPRPYEAALKQAEATLARDLAQAKNADEQAKRYEILVQKNYVSKDQYEQLRANADALAAAVEADKANVENGRLQLAYCTIRSPINGRAGTVLVNAGNVVKASDVAMTTINQILPIYVTFSVPELNLEDIKKYMAKGDLNVDAIVPGDETHPARGALTFIDNAVDNTTGTIKLKGTFENRDKRLWPGQFVNVVLTLTVQRNAVIMPSAAAQAGQQGQYVFVVKPDLTVESRQVTVSRPYGEFVIVDQGVTPGEKVVTDGQLQLFPGAHIEVKAEQTQSGAEKAEAGAKSPGKATN
ncbi:MAG TPA: efflux RND transporter periplasmic adaptor subunit [Nitrospirota bacterium]|nr:efflux RND transporter periplasmic adaptor subunit [Nitrospirota bacterium]